MSTVNLTLLPLAGAPAGSPTSDLLATILSMIQTDSVFTAAGLSSSLTQAPETAQLPWMVLAILPGQRVLRTLGQGNGTVFTYTIQFSLFAGSAIQTTQLIDRLATLFDSQSFAAGAETVIQSYLQRAPTARQVQRLTAGEPVFSAVAIYRFDLFLPT